MREPRTLKPRCGLPKKSTAIGKNKASCCQKQLFFQQSKPRGQHCISSKRSQKSLQPLRILHMENTLPETHIIPETLQRLHMTSFLSRPPDMWKKMVGIFAHVDDFAWEKSCKKLYLSRWHPLPWPNAEAPATCGTSVGRLPSVSSVGSPVCSKKTMFQNNKSGIYSVFMHHVM